MKLLKIEADFEIRVRYAHTDKMGVVYNSNYLDFFEIGRTELLRSFGLPYSEVEDKGFLLPLIDAYVKYQNPAKYDDILRINTKFELRTGAKIRFDYNIFCQDKLICQGYTSHIFVLSSNLKPIRPPKFFVEHLQNLN